MLKIRQNHPSVFEAFNRLLQSDDVPMIDQLIEFISNSAGESQLNREIILNETYTLDACKKVVTKVLAIQSIKVKEKLLSNVVWCLQNLSLLD